MGQSRADTGPDPATRVDNHRLDAFVDAAFAFAVTLLIVAGGQAPTSVGDLYAGLARVPAFAAGFALISMFWLGHRSFSELVPHRDSVTVALSLAIVFMTLVYVLPLQMLVTTGAHYLSGGRLPGGDLITRLSDLRDIFTVYGLGFAALSGLYVALFRHGERRAEALGATPVDRASLRHGCQTWALIAASGLLSALLAQLFPTGLVYGLPGFAYWLIPLGLGLLAWQRRRTSGTRPDKA